MVKIKNLAYELSEVKQVCNGCRTCAKVKPPFYWPDSSGTIKAIQPYERFTVNFEWPITTNTDFRNRFLFTVLDEFSQHPWAFATPGRSAETVIKCLTSIIALGGAPGYVCEKPGSNILDQKVKEFLR